MDVSILDPYVTLEVSPRASAPVIKAAYHALSKESHPDRSADDDLNSMVDRAKALNAAYATLSDPKKRAKFDKDVKSGTLIGNYKVLEEIAEGGFGTTYKGEHTLTKAPVCIKHCSEVSNAHDAVLINEARAIWDLRHYALPVMRDMQRLEDGSLALIMSYIEGPTLEQVVEKAGKLDAETVAWITERILNALLYLHHHGVVHGDIKPQNIIVQPATHSVVLIDFGLAIVKPGGSTKSMGYTPTFAPPEQVAGKTLLPPSDFYSLGMLMIYALCGGDMAAVEARNVPSSVPDPVCTFIKSLVKKNVLLRPQDGLFDQFREIRQKAFGRARTGMKPIAGL
jgi:serine/threonine protein kinase